MNKIHMDTLAFHAQITDNKNFRAGGVGVGSDFHGSEYLCAARCMKMWEHEHG